MKVRAAAVCLALLVATPAFGQVFSAGPGLGLNFGPTNETSTITADAPASITDLNVCVDLIHTWDSDITLTLTSPLGTSVVLSDRNGGSGDNYTFTLFDDEASTSVVGGFSLAPFSGPFIPENPLSAFDTEDATGDWTLSLNDAFPGSDDGTLNYWSLAFNDAVDAACAPPPPPSLNSVVTASFDATGATTANPFKLLGNTANGTDVLDGVGGSPFAAGSETGSEDVYSIQWGGGVMRLDLFILTGGVDLDLFIYDSDTATAPAGIAFTTANPETLIGNVPAGKYYVRVDGFLEDEGEYSLRIVPEPATLALLGLGAVALIRRRR